MTKKVIPNFHKNRIKIQSAPVADCKIPAFVQCWMYNRPNLLPTVEKVIFRQ